MEGHAGLISHGYPGIKETHNETPEAHKMDHSMDPSGPAFSTDPVVEGYIHNPTLTDVHEQRTEEERQLDFDILKYLQSINVSNPQVMRRFILACMERNVTEKDLLWMYHMRDTPQNGTLPPPVFIAITKQHLKDNTQLTHDKDYEVLADCYTAAFGVQPANTAKAVPVNVVRYVNLCNDLFSWRILNHNYQEFPLRQLYPRYRYPQKENYPRPLQGDWHLDTPRRESHQLPTMTFEEIKTIPVLLQRISQAAYEHHRYDALCKRFEHLEKLKDDKTVNCGVVPHDNVRQALLELAPLRLLEKDIENLCFYYEHPYILHFFRYIDFLKDVKYEMAQIDRKFEETPKETRLTSILNTLKRYVHNAGLIFNEPFRDFDTFGKNLLNTSQMKRALHVLRIGPGQRCDISEADIDFLLKHYVEPTAEGHVNYKKLNDDLMRVFVEKFYPGGRLAMVMESFEPNLARGPYYPPRAPLLTREDILQTPSSDPDKLAHVISRLKMMVVERRMHLEQIFRVFDLHSIRYVQNVRTVPRILQLATLQVTTEECDLIIEKFSDKKGFRYFEFLQTIDTQSYGQSLPTYPITVATMEQWKNKRAWYPEVTPQNAHQNYQGPEAVVEKCRRKVAIDRLRVSDFFVDYDTHHRGVITRKQFRRCTTMMGFQLSPMENLILENRYVYPRDLNLLDYSKFVWDMDLVYAPKGVSEKPALIPEPYKFQKVCDRKSVSDAEVALAQEGFHKLAEKILEARIHIIPYFVDFDPWKRGGISANRFRRVINALGLDVLSEVEWRAFIKNFARASSDYFDYRAFMDKVRASADKRERNLFDDPRMGPLKAIP